MANCRRLYRLNQERGAEMSQHFDYTEKEYRQKRSRRAAAILSCFLAIVVIVIAAFFVENAAMKFVLAIIGAILMFRLLHVDLLPKQEVFKEVATRRLLIIRLWQLVDELVKVGDGEIVFGRRRWSLRQVADGVIRLAIPGVGEYNITPRGVEDIDDKHIDLDEVKLIIHELEDRVDYARRGQELANRTDPLAGSTSTQPSEELFRH